MEQQIITRWINASPEKVWDTLWDDKSYRKWAAPFFEGSYAVSDFKKGSKVLFLSPGENGMVSKVDDVKTNEYMVFKHLGEVKEGVEDYDSETAKQWSGAREAYFLQKKDNGTELRVELDMDVSSEVTSYLLSVWPKALDELQKLAEAK